MQAQEVINIYLETSDIADHIIQKIQSDRALRSDLCRYIRRNKNRAFALEVLNRFIALRKDPEKEILVDDLMLGCYILGFHQSVSDCLLIWLAKNVDFDTYAGVDIQLVAFAGIAPTLEYLGTVDTEQAAEALDYLSSSAESGDLDYLDQYFSEDKLPWWV